MTLVDIEPPTTQRDRLAALPAAIIGAGPIGLAVAANLFERGVDFVIYEAGESAAASVRLWGHARLFSPWRHLIDPASARLLAENGWTRPNENVAPTGRELVSLYLEPLANFAGIASRTQTEHEVIAVSREGMDRTRTSGRSAAPFVLRVRTADGVKEVTARAVIDASGTYRSPNPLASSGLDPLGVTEVQDRVTHALPDVLGAERSRFTGKHVTVVGAGHSAANTLIALAKLARDEPETRLSWLIRNRNAVRVSSSPDDEIADRARLGRRVDQLVQEGVIALIDGFEIDDVRGQGDGILLTGRRSGRRAEHATEVVVNATGFRPNLSMLREIRLELDDIVEAPRRLAPLIDPNLHSCGTVEPHGFRELTQPEDGFFIVGMKSYGRAPTFLLATGYEQARSVSAWLAGDSVAASTVELVLPATGVCSTDVGDGSPCCP